MSFRVLSKWHQATIELFPDVAVCMAAQQSADISVAICSNWGWDLAEDLARAGVARLGDIMVSSAGARVQEAHPKCVTGS